MGAGDDLQGAVLRGGGVEVDADRQHPLQHFFGSFDMRDPVLGGRAQEAAAEAIVLHGDVAVFVPGERPALIGRLVEKEYPHQSRFGAEVGADDFEEGGMARQFANRRPFAEQVARSVDRTTGGIENSRVRRAGDEGFPAGNPASAFVGTQHARKQVVASRSMVESISDIGMGSRFMVDTFYSGR